MSDCTTRVCSRCGVERLIDRFRTYTNTNRRGEVYSGVRSVCKDCHNAENRGYYSTDAYRALSAQRRADPLVKVKRDAYNAEYRKRASTKKRMREYAAKRHAAEPRWRLDNSVSTYIRSSLASGKSGASWEALVGYTLDDLMRHLEPLFRPGMTWDNYGRGGWHIDHITPRAAFTYTSPDDDDFSRCWALENLQPLWESDNLKKNDKLPDGSLARRRRTVEH